MARRSVQLNGLEHIIRIHALPVEIADEVLAPGSIDVIVCNPPYGHHGTTLPNPAQTLSLARHQQKSGLTAWFKMAYHLLRGKGADGGHLPGGADAGSDEGHGESRTCAEAVPADLPLGAKGGESGDD